MVDSSKFQTVPTVFEFSTLSIIWYSKKPDNTTYQKLDLFPSSGDGKAPTLLDLLERDNLNHCTKTTKELCGLSPRANYTDRETAACRRS
jgi:hypothetical protein